MTSTIESDKDSLNRKIRISLRLNGSTLLSNLAGFGRRNQFNFRVDILRDFVRLMSSS